MSISYLSGPFNLPSPHVPARVSLAIANINLDAVQVNRGVASRDVLDVLEKRDTPNEFIESLWNHSSNADLVNAFLGNEFIKFAAQNTDGEVLPYYQAYGLQDYFYLIDYVRFKALRLNTIPEDDWEDLATEANGLQSDVQWVQKWKDVLLHDLKVTSEKLASAERSVAELAYSNVLQRHASIDDWFDLHVIMIPCVYGWPKLAKKVDEDPKTKKDTIFYKTWVKPNLDQSSAKNLSAFLEANSMFWAAGIDKPNGTKMGKWNELFRTALKLEVALFNSSGIS